MPLDVTPLSPFVYLYIFLLYFQVTSEDIPSMALLRFWLSPSLSHFLMILIYFKLFVMWWSTS